MAKAILTKSQLDVLEIISDIEPIKNFYLAGGTALALHLGHRYSEDFDFFSPKSFRPEAIIEALKNRGKIKVIQLESRTLHLKINNIKVSFIHFTDKLLFPLIKKENNLRLASIPDISAMKVAAICSRGSKKDFFDLYTISTQCFSLQKSIDYFSRKIKPVRYEFYHIVKSLQYFGDAEKEIMPNMILKVSWHEVKKFFEKETRELEKK